MMPADISIFCLHTTYFADHDHFLETASSTSIRPRFRLAERAALRP